MSDIAFCEGCGHEIERRPAYAEKWRGQEVLVRHPVWFIAGSLNEEHPFPCDAEFDPTEEELNRVRIHLFGSLEGFRRAQENVDREIALIEETA